MANLNSMAIPPLPIKPGDTVEYSCVSGTIHVKVLQNMPGGKLQLATASKNKLVKVLKKSNDTVGDIVTLSKNVTVSLHRVRRVKRANPKRDA